MPQECSGKILGKQQATFHSDSHGLVYSQMLKGQVKNPWSKPRVGVCSVALNIVCIFTSVGLEIPALIPESLRSDIRKNNGLTEELLTPVSVPFEKHLFCQW